LPNSRIEKLDFWKGQLAPLFNPHVTLKRAELPEILFSFPTCFRFSEIKSIRPFSSSFSRVFQGSEGYPLQGLRSVPCGCIFFFFGFPNASEIY
jgi:hypothetical protein